MRYKLICCEVFLREACNAIYGSPHIIDPVFTAKGEHENSDRLRQVIQDLIDKADAEGIYDAVILGFGLCGNSTAGLQARSVPLVLPRAHDCCTLFLGSKESFVENFKDNLSAEWSSAGYLERGDSYLRETETGKLLGVDKSYQEYVELYGEENAAYLWETLHPEQHNDEIIYIEIPETSHLGYLGKMKQLAEEKGKNLRVINGDMILIRKLLYGDWSESEYLIIPPGKTVKAVYDQHEIVKYE